MNVYCSISERLREKFSSKQRLAGLMFLRRTNARVGNGESYERIGYREYYHSPGTNKLVESRDSDWKTIALV